MGTPRELTKATAVILTALGEYSTVDAATILTLAIATLAADRRETAEDFADHFRSALLDQIYRADAHRNEAGQ